MSAFFTLIANGLFPLRNFIFYLCISLVLYLDYLFIFSSHNQQALYLLPSLLGFLWALMLLVFCHSFHQSYDNCENNSIKDGFFSRIKSKVKNWFVWCYSLVFIALIIISLYFTYKVNGL